jgi:hypothetical protein
MPWLATLNASKQLELVLGVIFSSPDLEAPDLLVSIEPASVALDDIRLRAVDREMPDLVALETNLLSALERIVGILAAQDACGSLRLIGAVSGPVAALPTVLAPQQGVLTEEVPRLLSLHHLVEFLFLI